MQKTYSPLYECPECYYSTNNDEYIPEDECINYVPDDALICEECGAFMEFDKERSFED